MHPDSALAMEASAQGHRQPPEKGHPRQTALTRKPPQPALPQQAKQERSLGPGLLEGSMLESAELMQHLQPPASFLLPPMARTKEQSGEGLCLWAAVPCSTSLHLTCQVQNTRTEPVLNAASLQALGTPLSTF